MPTKTNVTQFGAKIRSYGYAAEQAQLKGVKQAALMLKRSIERETHRAMGGGDMVFSNMDTYRKRNGLDVPAKSPSRLRVGYDIVGVRNPTALLVARGPWGLIEYGSVPHVITTRMTTIQRKGMPALAYQRATKQRSLNVAFNARGTFSGQRPMSGKSGGGIPRFRVNHTGTKGKRPFHRGIDLVRKAATIEARSIITNEFVRTLRSGKNQYLTFVGDRSGFEVSAWENGLR
jgi:hypothetical protein